MALSFQTETIFKNNFKNNLSKNYVVDNFLKNLFAVAIS